MRHIYHKIQKLISYYEKYVGSRNPQKIANWAGIKICVKDLGEIQGFFKVIKRTKWIFVNENLLDTPMFDVVLAHELGHALLHNTQECVFLKYHTFLLSSRKELEANLFAAELLIVEDPLSTVDEYAYLPTELLELRMRYKK